MQGRRLLVHRSLGEGRSRDREYPPGIHRASQAATQPSVLETIGTRLAGVLGVFLTLAVLGFGLVMFARPNLEVISDTASHSFGRAFVTGLLGQILVIPTFGMSNKN